MAIIIRIELKLQDYCGSYFAENDISTGNANAYFKDNEIDLQNPKVGGPGRPVLVCPLPCGFPPLLCVQRNGSRDKTHETPPF